MNFNWQRDNFKGTSHLDINPLVQFQRIEPHISETGRKWFVHKGALRQRYRVVLQGKRGIYFFHDSSGMTTYVGLTNSRTNDLFKEIEQRLEDAKARTPRFEGKKDWYGLRQRNPVQGEIARYLSAYEIVPAGAIKRLETLIIRGMINSIQNHNLESF